MNNNKRAFDAYKKMTRPSKETGGSDDPAEPADPGKTAKSSGENKAAGSKKPEMNKQPAAPPAGTQSGDSGLSGSSAFSKAVGGSSGAGAYERVARFLLLLGKEEASQVLSQLDEGDVLRIAEEISKIKKISHDEAQQILNDFGRRIDEESTRVRGGVDTARSMLQAAMGEEKAQEILKRAVPESSKRPPFEFLNDLSKYQLQFLLRNESPSALSVILSYIKAEQASKVIEGLEAGEQLVLVKNIARKRQIQPEILEKMEVVLKEKLRRLGKDDTEQVDGTGRLAQILRHMNYSVEQKILDELQTDSPDLSDQVREKLFTVDRILRIYDKHLQQILRDFENRELALFLKDKKETLRAKIFGNVSSRRRMLIKEDMEDLGEVRKSDVDAATNDFLSYLREQEEDGELIIEGEEDTYVE
ncbi:MAG: flagellar motor switch protein FliG [Spirochaetales bacterium]|nr:flagellar motor switch protein FliG [Spirochaetales bacterium]MCF7937066.1 flagellar motor switch protein FliG [Spirochaetales bacterium]